jgi:RNA polymerase sigma-70 factor (ECF subfamily)
MDEVSCREQDTERFVRLFTEGQREILRYILALVPDVDAAHEILQETAIALWKKFDQYESGYPFVPWACRFAFRHVLKYREQKARRGKYLSLDVLDLLAAERWQEDEVLEERRRALASCLKALDDAERALVEQRYSKRTTVAQLAAATGQNASTLYKVLERVRRRLFECINRRLELGSLS